MSRVAVIGLGTMGLPMARHLVAAGHDVIGCDLDPARVTALGAGRVDTPSEAAAAADVALLSLPTPAAVEQVVLGPRGVRAGAAPGPRGGRAGAAPGPLLVDWAPRPPRLARRLASECGALDVLDAPVSGGPQGAEDATLTIMVGGDEATFRRALPIFETLGRLVVLVGAHGAGQAAKLCNNLIAGATMAAIAEACAIARREEIDPRTLYEVVGASTGDSRVLRTRFPLAGADGAHPSSNGFAPLFALDLIAKDMELALQLGEAHGVAARVARAALDAYRDAQRDGWGALDYSAVYLRFDAPGAAE